MSMRQELEGAPDVPATIDATEESYMGGIQSLAKVFLRELDKRGADWQPASESATALGDDLYAAARDQVPAQLRGQLTGNQVMEAALLAFRAFKGDGATEPVEITE